MSSCWGNLSSKQHVSCAYCGVETRCDNLKRHTNNLHPGQSVKYNRIQLPGQSSLIFQRKIQVEDLDNAQPDLNDDISDQLVEEQENFSDRSSGKFYWLLFRAYSGEGGKVMEGSKF